MSRDLVTIARDLYAGRPQDFTVWRDELAQQARSEGGRALAAAVKKLRKPSAAAWVVNALSATDRFDDLDDLREQLLSAQAAVDGVAMRQLGRDARVLARQIAESGSVLADEAGVVLSAAALAEVQETLRAVTVDAGVAAAVRTGFMVRSVTSTGLEAVDVSAAVAVASALPDVEEPAEPEDDQPSATVSDLSAARTRREEREAKRAEEEQKRAEAQRARELRAAQKQLDAVTAAAKQAEQACTASTTRLEKAGRALAEAQQVLDEAQAAEEESRAAADEARLAVDAARADVDRLTDP
ncbi:MAG: hypothetical protein Q7T56_19230 [Nocardioidaceae bacterium]|nr:hypothetical protein [Nocardioidaceae bacterium]